MLETEGDPIQMLTGRGTGFMLPPSQGGTTPLEDAVEE